MNLKELFEKLNHHSKKFSWPAILAVIFSIGLICLPGTILAASYNVTGQAQVLNTGSALSFTGFNANVSISDTNGQFSGYGWSEDLGWIAFGTQDNPSGPVSLDCDTGMVSGQAGVINDGTTIDFNSAPYSSNVSVFLGNFSGFAWSDSIGWINFTGVYTDAHICDSELPYTGR